MEYFVNFSTVLAAFLALLISLYSAWISKRGVVTEAISSNRIEWVGNVRKLLFSFLAEYRKALPDSEILINVYTQIVLYCNPQGDTYKGLITAMKCGINTGYSDECYWSIVREGQKVLDSSWRRMKREAGVTFWREKMNAWKYARESNEKVKLPVWDADIQK